MRGLSSLLVAGLGLGAAIAAGCGARLERQREWVIEHPRAPAAVKKAVLGKKLQPGIGMTEDAVRASWGNPKSTLDLGAGDSRWTYEREQSQSGVRLIVEYTLVFKRGELIRVLQQRRR
jgi:hypothetical protein